MATLAVRLVGRQLPGLRCGPYESIHAGIQRGREVVDLVPGNAAEAVFAFTVDVVTGSDGAIDCRGPFVQGRRGERFVYLSWGELKDGSPFAMFRRAKLHLSCLDASQLAQAATAGATLLATLALTDARGGPLCASVRPPQISWQVLPPS